MKKMLRVLSLVLCAALALSVSASALASGNADVKITKRTLKKSTDSYEYKLSYPRTGITDIDNEIKAFVNREKKAFLRQVEEYAADSEVEYALPKSTLDINFKLYRPNRDCFSFLFTVSGYYGGAHPTTFHKAMNFSAGKGEQIDLAEVFVEGWEEKLAKLCEKPLLREMGVEKHEEDFIGWIREGLLVENAFHGLVLTKNGVVIGFDDYQVGPYATGAPVISLSKKAIRSLLRD